ncbi:hypothetical protein D9M71_808320 [compost metagenome]
MGATQLLFAGAQLRGPLLDHFQRPLPLTDQYIQQGAEQHTEQATEHDQRGH